MTHRQIHDFVATVKKHFPEFFVSRNVLEIGSLNINGSVRAHFEGGNYIGVDLAPGPDVDVVRGGHLLDYESESFDTVISCECMEHNPFWVETISNMFRMTKPGGIVIISCASTGREEHGTSKSQAYASPFTIEKLNNYYKNVSAADIKAVFNCNLWFDYFFIDTNHFSMDTYFVGIRKPAQDSARFHSLCKDLKALCRPQRTLRGTVVFVTAALGGEQGVALLRRLARLVGLGLRG